MSADGQGRAWGIFRRNTPALAGLIIFVFLIVCSLFSGWLVQDGSPHAGRQFSELGRLAPGSKVQLLKVSKSEHVPEISCIEKLYQGQPLQYKYFPLQENAEIFLQSDSLWVQTWQGERRYFLLPLVLHAVNTDLKFNKFCLDYGRKPYAVLNGKYIWQTDAGYESYTQSALEEKLYRDHLEGFTFYMGTDGFGRDVFSRLLLGSRISIGVGVVAVFISLLLGVVLGALAGYTGGKTDACIQWFVSVIWSLPSLLLAMVLSFVLGKGIWQVFIAVGFTLWVDVARVVRGQVMGLKNMSWVEAARTLGYSNFRILFLHIVPNLTGPLIILAASNFATAVLIESGLSFLGIGIQPPVPSWGNLIQEGYTQIVLSNGQWLAIFPGAAILILVVSLNLIGYGLRDAFDPGNTA